MVNSHETPKHTVATANPGDVNVLPFRVATANPGDVNVLPFRSGEAVSQPKARQLSPMPSVAPVVREG